MQFKNTSKKFGILTKLLHWTIFLLVVVEYFLVYRREYFPKGSLEKTQYMMLHKSFGLCILLLALLMLVSRNIGKRPVWPANMNAFQVFIAKLTHFFLYLALLFQPITGIFMSAFGGYKITFFNLYELPIHLAKNPSLSQLFAEIHVWVSYFIIGIVIFHVLGALYHQYIARDDVLKRML